MEGRAPRALSKLRMVAEGLVVAVPVNGSVEHPAVAHISEPAIANETNARMM